jgi:hypothetical protein
LTRYSSRIPNFNGKDASRDSLLPPQTNAQHPK